MLERREGFIKLKILEEYVKEIEYVSLFFVLLLIPLFIGEPQYIVGSIVNAVLIYSTLRFGFKNTIPFLVLPSCMSYLRGILFGNLTIFLIYLIPFIIISNAIYSFTTNQFQGKALGIFLACILKMLFLYSVTTILINIDLLPKLFFTTMGINQLITAIIGGRLGYIVYKKIKV
jgi:hypothetical protein